MRKRKKPAQGDEACSMKKPDHKTKASDSRVEKITNRSFDWGDNPPSPQNSEQLELDYLWKEFEHCLKYSEERSESTKSITPDIFEGEERDRELGSCCRDDRNQILDEEIGIRCKCCGHILREIRDVCAPFLHP